MTALSRRTVPPQQQRARRLGATVVTINASQRAYVIAHGTGGTFQAAIADAINTSARRDGQEPAPDPREWSLVAAFPGHLRTDALLQQLSILQLMVLRDASNTPRDRHGQRHH